MNFVIYLIHNRYRAMLQICFAVNTWSPLILMLHTNLTRNCGIHFDYLILPKPHTILSAPSIRERSSNISNCPNPNTNVIYSQGSNLLPEEALDDECFLPLLSPPPLDLLLDFFCPDDNQLLLFLFPSSAVLRSLPSTNCPFVHNPS